VVEAPEAPQRTPIPRQHYSISMITPMP